MIFSVILKNNPGSLLVFILIFIDYLRKYNTNVFQRIIFLQILIYAMAALGSNLFFGILNIWTDPDSGNLSLSFFILRSFYYVFMMLSFFHVAVFMDYSIHKDTSRSKKAAALSWITGFVFCILLVLFDRNSEFIHIIFGYFPVMAIAMNIILSQKYLIKHHLHMLFVFGGAISTGILSDYFLGTIHLVWPCYTAVLLYTYLYIIQNDSKLDALTGIGNRYAFNEFMEKLSRKGTREKGENIQSYYVIMIDIDHFKLINDVLGHAEGDNALRDMAVIIKGCIRYTDFAARYGGDEFILAVPAEYDIQKILERIQESISVQNSKNLRPYKLEISYGCDIYTPGKHKFMDDFLNHIDSLMYKNKEENRRLRSGVMEI